MTEDERKAKRSLSAREYYARNREALAIRFKKYQQDNKEKIQDYQCQYYIKNRAKKKQQSNDNYYKNMELEKNTKVKSEDVVIDQVKLNKAINSEAAINVRNLIAEAIFGAGYINY